MVIWDNILYKLKKTLVYFMVLVASFFLLTLAFAAIYYFKGIEDAVFVSVSVFFDFEIDPKLYSAIYSIIIAEKICKEIFIVVFLGKVLSEITDRANPIFFSKYVTYIEQKNTLRFRIWIMLPAGEYLYNATISVSLLKKDSLYKGVDKTVSVLDIKPNETNFPSIRGIWELEVSSKSPSTPSDILNAMTKDKELKIRAVFKGVNGKGEILQRIVFYTLEDIIENCEFVSVKSSDFLEEKHEEFFRYQNFNKVFIPFDKESYELIDRIRKKHTLAQNDILTKDEINKKKYHGKGMASKLDDFFSAVFRLKYNPKN